MQKFKRNAKFWGIELTPEFLDAFIRTNKLLNKLSRHIRKMVLRGDIEAIRGLGYVTFSESSGIKNPHKDDPEFDGKENELTKAQFKDLLNFLFPKEIVKKESLKRELLMHVLERYSGYFNRNGNKKVPTISIKGKGLPINDAMAKIDQEAKVITMPTLFGNFDLKYSHSLKGELLNKIKTGGNFNLKQKCFIVAVDVPFKQLYIPICYLGFDLNKTEADWIVLSDGTKISAPDNVSQLFSEIKEINKCLDQDKKLPIAQRKYRSKQRRKLRLRWKKLHGILRNQIREVAEKIINKAISKKAHLCIDSVKCGQTMGTFGQDHLIPLLQTMCENRGVPFHVVPCKDTSKRCSECGHIATENRVDTETFICQKCGVHLDAQQNGAYNVEHVGKRLNEANIPYGNWSKNKVETLIKKYSDQVTEVLPTLREPLKSESQQSRFLFD
jgi:transposase